MIKNFVIAVLLVVVILFLITNPTYKSSVIVKTDTVYQQKTFTKYKKGNDIHSYTILTDSVLIPVHDTIKIISDYSRVYSYLDTIRLDTNNVVFIQDTITQNRIIGRGLSANLSEKTIIQTRTITPKPKNALYLGVLADLRQDKSLQGVGIGLMLKVKDRALIGVGFDSNNFIRTSFYFKL